MSNKLSLLIVDDEKNSADLLYDHFLNMDYKLLYKAYNCKEALKILRGDKVDLVVTDQRMPNMLGIELLSILKEEMPEVMRILLTGFVDFEQAIKAINQGVIHHYLSKPLNLEELDNIILGQERVKKRVESQQQQLAQIDKMASLGIMAAGVVHEINNPLSVAIGDIHLFGEDVHDLLVFIDRFSENFLPQDKLKEVEKLKSDMDITYVIEGIDKKISRCKDAMERVKDIVQHLREFSHMDTDEMAETDINKSIESALELIPKRYKQDIDIKIEFVQLPKVFCHGRQINQVFMNLITNALQAMKEEGTLNIETSADDNYVYTKFCDSGPGISEDKLKKIFDPFFTTKPVGEGTGLGLSISYSIIEKHGGEITVENNLDKKGVTFMIKLLKKGVLAKSA